MKTNGERGSAAMMAVFLMATLFSLFLTAFLLLQANNAVIGRQLSFNGQAANAAQAGLVETLAWFRKQTTQPVAVFDPKRNLAASPPLNETDDAAIGIVREYEISRQGSVWGRYEVKRSKVVDVGAARGKSGSGIVWEVESEGIVFVKLDPTKRFDESPNRVISRQTARSELQRLSMVLPGNAGINSSRGDRVTLATRARVFGGTTTGIGILHAASTGSPSVCAYPCRVTGNPATSQASPYNASVPNVFGVTQQELVGLADLVVTSQAELPTNLPDMALLVINGNATFTASRPLIGTGILVVFGNLTIDTSSYSSYNGLIYVTGNYTQRAPSQVSGALVGAGTIRLEGTGDFSELSYDPSILQQIQQRMGQYRFSRSTNFGRVWR